MPSPNRESMESLSRATKSLRQRAAGIVRQALIQIESHEPLPQSGKHLVTADRQALEAAFVALTAPTPIPQEKRNF